MIARINSDLANDLGNCLNRVEKMIDSHFGDRMPARGQPRRAGDGSSRRVSRAAAEAVPRPDRADPKLHQAIEETLELVRAVNRYLEVKAPWKAVKTEGPAGIATTLATAAEAIRLAVALLFPVMPGKCGEALVPPRDARRAGRAGARSVDPAWLRWAGLAWGRRSARRRAVPAHRDRPGLFPRIETDLGRSHGGFCTSTRTRRTRSSSSSSSARSSSGSSGAARRGSNLFIRKIAGLNAIDEAVGRATELGKKVLYVPGIMSIDENQTIASLAVLAHVARMTARYNTELDVPNKDPLTFAAARETVKEAYIQEGRPDLYNESIVHYVTYDQFAYTASVSGIMMREQPGHELPHRLLLRRDRCSWPRPARRPARSRSPEPPRSRSFPSSSAPATTP